MLMLVGPRRAHKTSAVVDPQMQRSETFSSMESCSSVRSNLSLSNAAELLLTSSTRHVPTRRVQERQSCTTACLEIQSHALAAATDTFASTS